LFTFELKGPDKNSYYHEQFLRGKPELAQIIPRLEVKGKGSRRASDSLDPNFYAMPILPSPSTSTGSRSPAASSMLVTAHRMPEIGATSSMTSSTGGFAAMDPTLSVAVVAVAGGLLPITPLAPTEEAMLQLWLSELQRLEQQQQQQQLRRLMILSTLQQDYIRHDQTTRFAALSTPQLLDASNPSSHFNVATIGHCALALAMARAARNENRMGMF
jgi:hypothetical protein